MRFDGFGKRERHRFGHRIARKLMQKRNDIPLESSQGGVGISGKGHDLFFIPKCQRLAGTLGHAVKSRRTDE